MNLYAIRRRSGWAHQQELEATAAKSARIGEEDMADEVRWIRSYLVEELDGRLGTVCIYEAIGSESIVKHSQCVGMPADEILPVFNTVIVRPDPPAL